MYTTIICAYFYTPSAPYASPIVTVVERLVIMAAHVIARRDGRDVYGTRERLSAVWDHGSTYYRSLKRIMKAAIMSLVNDVVPLHHKGGLRSNSHNLVTATEGVIRDRSGCSGDNPIANQYGAVFFI